MLATFRSSGEASQTGKISTSPLSAKLFTSLRSGQSFSFYLFDISALSLTFGLYLVLQFMDQILCCYFSLFFQKISKRFAYSTKLICRYLLHIWILYQSSGYMLNFAHLPVAKIYPFTLPNFFELPYFQSQ